MKTYQLSFGPDGRNEVKLVDTETGVNLLENVPVTAVFASLSDAGSLSKVSIDVERLAVKSEVRADQLRIRFVEYGMAVEADRLVVCPVCGNVDTWAGETNPACSAECSGKNNPDQPTMLRPTEAVRMLRLERERKLTFRERYVWDDCPECPAKHGEPCVGTSVHKSRLDSAPNFVRLYASRL